jgi:small neutral amino acid transporter SnatA (MarC family)
MGNVPLFIALTQKMEKNEGNAVSKIVVITAAALLTVLAGFNALLHQKQEVCGIMWRNVTTIRR